MTKAMILVPGSVTLDDLEILYRQSPPVRLREDTHDKINAAAAVLAKAAQGSDAVYGVNTGFGKPANTKIAPAIGVCAPITEAVLSANFARETDYEIGLI